MSIMIENAEAETLLVEMSARTGRPGTDLLLDLLRRERERLDTDQARDSAEAVASGRLLHERWMARPVIDPRPVEEILAWDQNGLPV